MPFASGGRRRDFVQRAVPASSRVPLSGRCGAHADKSLLTEQFRTQAKLEGQWTVFGLAQELAVHRNWLYTRIRNRTLPATRHAVLGHYLIPDTPEVMTTLRAQR